MQRILQRKKLMIGLAAFLAILLAVDWLSGGVSQRLIYGTAQLSIESTPPGAAVFIDGSAVGVTPIGVAARPGEVILKLSHRFHSDFVERLRVARGEDRKVAIVFPPERGSLRVITNPKGAKVKVNDEPLAGETPLDIASLATGEHVVRMTIPGRAAVTRTVEVLPGAASEVSVDLERIPMGVLIVQVTPEDATVTFADGALRYRSGMDIPIGDYALTVSRPGYASLNTTAKVNVGRTVHTVVLEQQFAQLQVRARPANATIEVHHGAGRLAKTEPYYEGMRLAVGTVEVKAQAPGYRRFSKSLQLKAQGTELAIDLQRIDVRAGETIADALRVGGIGPDTIVVAAGPFVLGGVQVAITQPFAMGVYEVTRAQYRAFADATARGMPDAQAHETDTHPIVKVDRDDATAYVRWLSAQSGHHYRLPSEAEWEYAARAGMPAVASATICEQGNVADKTAAKSFRDWDTADCDDGQVRTAAVGSYRPNAFGLYDVVGNVSEWVQDCWYADHAKARRDGGARVDPGCMNHVVKGGSWDVFAQDDYVSGREPASSGADDRGFRVLREF
ncbi:MAG: SUMF1/EgtB/PvdO family nonheme iron enzyme [Gammaproteobacteria bacterium]|nr:SUMF1/EgtB/PvdO family nonheme iron enzyme [Gammaproteobacteria bacterium]